MKHQLLQEAEAMQEQLVTWRRGLHRIPETGTHLPQTVTFIKNQLDAIGVAYKIHEECSCITAELGKGEPCIMLRSDMDGLPIKEESVKHLHQKMDVCMPVDMICMRPFF